MRTDRYSRPEPVGKNRRQGCGGQLFAPSSHCCVSRLLRPARRRLVHLVVNGLVYALLIGGARACLGF